MTLHKLNQHIVSRLTHFCYYKQILPGRGKGADARGTSKLQTRENRVRRLWLVARFLAPAPVHDKEKIADSTKTVHKTLSQTGWETLKFREGRESPIRTSCCNSPPPTFRCQRHDPGVETTIHRMYRSRYFNHCFLVLKHLEAASARPLRLFKALQVISKSQETTHSRL